MPVPGERNVKGACCSHLIMVPTNTRVLGTGVDGHLCDTPTRRRDEVHRLHASKTFFSEMRCGGENILAKMTWIDNGHMTQSIFSSIGKPHTKKNTRIRGPALNIRTRHAEGHSSAHRRLRTRRVGWSTFMHSTDDTSGSLDGGLRMVDGWRADRSPHSSDIRCRSTQLLISVLFTTN